MEKMNKIGIFYSTFGDISQPKYSGDMSRAIVACSPHIIRNINKLIENNYLVDLHVLVNYEREIIPNLVENINNCYIDLPVNLNIEIIELDKLKAELLEHISYDKNTEIKESFDMFADRPANYIQTYQFLRQAYKYNSYDFFIKSRLDFFITFDHLYLNLIHTFNEAYKFRFSGNYKSKGYCITTNILLDSLPYGVAVYDVNYSVDKNTVLECFENFNQMFMLSQYFNTINNPGCAEQFLAHLLIKNNILTMIAPNTMGSFVYRSFLDRFEIDILQNKYKLDEVCKEMMASSLYSKETD